MNRDVISQFLNCGTIIGTPDKKVVIGWGNRTWKKDPTDDLESFFYFPDFFLEHEEHRFTHEFLAVIEIEHLAKLLNDYVCGDEMKMTWTDPDFVSFQKAYDDLQNHFKTGELIKAVPFIIEISNDVFDKDKRVRSLTKILDYVRNNKAFVYGFWTLSEGILGATPELLFHRKPETAIDSEAIIHTVACAGTCPNDIDVSRSLDDGKNAIEHTIVIKGIQEALEPYGEVRFGEPSVLTLPGLSHRITQIEFLPETPLSYDHLVKILHPTPALGAFPKEAGNRWLRTFYRNIDRKRYGAPVGYYLKENKESLCLVGIRNVQWSKEITFIAAGCGVVEQSHLWKEWDELKLKLAAIKEMLSL